MIESEEDEIRDRWPPQADDDSAARASVALEIDRSRHRAVARRLWMRSSGHVTKLDDGHMRPASDGARPRRPTGCEARPLVSPARARRARYDSNSSFRPNERDNP